VRDVFSDAVQAGIRAYLCATGGAIADTEGTDNSAINPDQHPWGQFITAVLRESPQLLELDLSYCVTTEPEALELFKGLAEGLKARRARQLPPLKKLEVNGLQLTGPCMSAIGSVFSSVCGPGLVTECDFLGSSYAF
jgi:hypothetical protein